MNQDIDILDDYESNPKTHIFLNEIDAYLYYRVANKESMHNQKLEDYHKWEIFEIDFHME